MSAVPIFLPPVLFPPVADPPVAVQPVAVQPVAVQPAAVQPAAVPPVSGAPASRPATIESHVRLTERGVAVVMLLAALILATALIVIGATALRVTSADYYADLHASSQIGR